MKTLFAGFALLGCAALSLWLWATPQRDERFEALAERLRELDEASPGQLGVYLLRPADGSELNHQADRTWYLASATKAAIAIAVLQEVDDGKLQLDQPITLEATGSTALAAWYGKTPVPVTASANCCARCCRKATTPPPTC